MQWTYYAHIVQRGVFMSRKIVSKICTPTICWGNLWKFPFWKAHQRRFHPYFHPKTTCSPCRSFLV